MNIIRFIKNAWNLRRCLSRYDEADYRSAYYILKECLKRTATEIEKVDEKAEIENDTALAALKDYICCLDKIVQDRFLENATKMILKDKFDENAFKENPGGYCLKLPEETFNKIVEQERILIEFTLNVMHKIEKDRTNGITSWYINKASNLK